MNGSPKKPKKKVSIWRNLLSVESSFFIFFYFQRKRWFLFLNLFPSFHFFDIGKQIAHMWFYTEQLIYWTRIGLLWNLPMVKISFVLYQNCPSHNYPWWFESCSFKRIVHCFGKHQFWHHHHRIRTIKVEVMNKAERSAKADTAFKVSFYNHF